MEKWIASSAQTGTEREEKEGSLVAKENPEIMKPGTGYSDNTNLLVVVAAVVRIPFPSCVI